MIRTHEHEYISIWVCSRFTESCYSWHCIKVVVCVREALHWCLLLEGSQATTDEFLFMCDNRRTDYESTIAWRENVMKQGQGNPQKTCFCEADVVEQWSEPVLTQLLAYNMKGMLNILLCGLSHQQPSKVLTCPKDTAVLRNANSFWICIQILFIPCFSIYSLATFLNDLQFFTNQVCLWEETCQTRSWSGQKTP